ncbi:MAG: ATP-dependent Clp protease proteolytic subunit [Fluviibacter sp.]
MTQQQSEEELGEDIELARAISEAEKVAHEARLAEVNVQKAEMELLETQINLNYQLAGEYNFCGRVDQKAMQRLNRQLRVWHKYKPNGEWVINLNSPGGDMYAGVGIVDEINSYSLRGGGSHRVEIRVRGVAASAAGMILQSADHRVIGRNSLLMIHKGSAGVHGTADDIADEHQWWERSVDQMISLFLSRTDQVTRAQFLRNINRKDWWLTAEEALDLGLCDEIR